VLANNVEDTKEHEPTESKKTAIEYKIESVLNELYSGYTDDLNETKDPKEIGKAIARRGTIEAVARRLGINIAKIETPNTI
jgi:hypothetical protein